MDTLTDDEALAMFTKGSNLRPSAARKLLDAIDRFAPRAISEDAYHLPDGAYNQCWEASETFLYCLDEAGIGSRGCCLEIYHLKPDDKREITDLDVKRDRDRLPFKVDEKYHTHVAVRVGNVIIDWTARQFDEKADFPSIWIDNSRTLRGKRRIRQAQHRAP